MSELKDLVLTESVPAKLVFSFEEFEKDLDEKLAAADLIVTVDNLKDMKKVSADLNKTAAKIKADFKTAKNIVLAPLDPIELKIKSMANKVLVAKDKISDQTTKFENKRKEIVKSVLYNALLAEWEKQGVEMLFRHSDFTPLVKLTAITAKDKATSASIQAIATMVAQDKSLQDQTEKRLLLLENQSYKSGLKAPLTRAHVESFLFQVDEIYQSNLDAMIASEIERQEVAEKAMRDEMQKKALRSVDINSAARDGVTIEPISKEELEEAKQNVPDGYYETRNTARINSLTGTALMGLGLTKAQAVKIMEMAYNGELYGLRMVY